MAGARGSRLDSPAEWLRRRWRRCQHRTRQLVRRGGLALPVVVPVSKCRFARCSIRSA